MDSDETESKQREPNSGKISIKKSMFSALVISVIAVSMIAAFFAGSYISLKSDEITNSELNEAIAKLESKILKNQQANVQPNIQPISVSIDDDPINFRTIRRNRKSKSRIQRFPNTKQSP